MQKFWSVPAIALYFYVATVLTDYGFLSYFNVPPSFIQASLSGNIVFFYQLSTAYGSLLGEMHWYSLAALGFAIGIMIALYYLIFQYKNRWKKILITLLTILWLLYLGTFFKLGNIIAANQTSFLVPSPNCSIGPNYVIPVIDENQTVLVPVDQNHKMTGGFLVKNTADLSCTVGYKEVGKITQ